jgi:hypothetical protein
MYCNQQNQLLYPRSRICTHGPTTSRLTFGNPSAVSPRVSCQVAVHSSYAAGCRQKPGSPPGVAAQPWRAPGVQTAPRHSGGGSSSA